MVYENMAAVFGVSELTITIILTIIGLWELVWKGFALWYSAQRKENVWFVSILVINSLGILPIIYLLMYKPWKAENGPVRAKKKA